MIALAQHLRRHDEQCAAGLAFRRDCPTCREERLAGRLPDDRIISVNARVTMAIGSLLAGGALPPGVAVADRGERSGEAIAVEAPHAPAPPKRETAPPDTLDAGAAPALDESDPQPGENHGRARDEGDTSAGAKPTHAPSQPRQPGASDARGDREPAGRSDGNDAPEAGEEPDSSAHAAPQTTAQAQEPMPATPTAHPQETAGTEAGREAAPAAPATASTGGRGSSPTRTGARENTHGSMRASTENTTRAQARSAPAASATHSPRSAPGATHTPNGTREPARAPSTYVVKQGDCLWYVAARHLGEGASDAAIAKEVTRLWKLNAKRIGTGDPDLIYAGQTLAL